MLIIYRIILQKHLKGGVATDHIVVLTTFHWSLYLFTSKSGGSSSLDVATGARRPTPPGTGMIRP